MSTRFGAKKVLFAVPLLFAVAAWAMPSVSVETVVPADVTASAVVTDATTDATADAPDVTTDEFFVINNCEYYNNASHSIVVGRFGYDCCNNPVAWGKKSKFYSCGGCFPCIPPPQ